MEDSSRARSRLFHTLPEPNARTVAPPLQPQPGRGCSHRPSHPPLARPARGCRCPGRRSLPTPASPLCSPRPQAAAVAGGRPGRAPRTHRALGEREPHRSAGPLSESAASAPCAPPSWEPGQAARCVITSQGVAREDRGPANGKRRRPLCLPPNPGFVSSCWAAAGGRRTGSEPIGPLKGKIANLRDQ